MSDTAVSPITVGLSPVKLTVVLGAVSDSSGTVLPNDVADPGSAAYTVSDPSLATLDPSTGDNTATGMTTGAAGTFTIGVSATVGGIAVTGTSAPLIAAAGPAASIEVNVTVG